MMHYCKLKIGAAFLAALIMLTGALNAPSCYADELSEKKAELERVEAQIAEMEAQRAAARKEAEAASAELNSVVERLRFLQSEQRRLQGEQKELEARIEVNQDELTQKQAKYAQRLVTYKKRLRDIYINGSVNYLDVLLGAKDFADFSSRMYLLQKIIASDQALLQTIKAEETAILSQQAALDSDMQDLDATLATLAAQEAAADVAREERAQMLYKAVEAKHASEAEYDRLAAISENVRAMLRNLEQSQVVTKGGSGQFMWPCSGEITSYYGWRTHPIFGTTRYHSGMDIAVDYGTPIHAADSGTVVYSGWLGGYGNCVMINHGGGLVSLYGHNQSLKVNEGQHVDKGDVISYAGSTGYSTGPHCHFEVRLHGEVTEPLNYLP